MIGDRSVLAIIPARGGSKGVAGKNIKKLGDKPLLAWTIEAANRSRYIDRTVLSSNSKNIISVAEEWGCEVPFVRPSELAQDETPGIEPVLHAVKQLPRYDYVVLLQPTSPLRSPEDIDGCIEMIESIKAKSCISVTETTKSPYWMYTLNDSGCMQPVVDVKERNVRRQDLPKVFVLNGAVYVADTEWLLESMTFLSEESVGYVMPQDRSLDIDTELDFIIAEQLLKIK